MAQLNFDFGGTFNPGDKIVRVGDGRKRGNPHPDGCPKYGKVYVVLDCWVSRTGNSLFQPVGFRQTYTTRGDRTGWICSAFRRVSEVGHPAIAVEASEPVTA